MINAIKKYIVYLGIVCFFNLEGQISSPSKGEFSSDNEQPVLNHILNLARGHQDFKTLDFKQNEEEFVRLVEKGQSPKTLFIGCSDSRVVPELILNVRPNDLFVVRTAGNFVPPYQALEVDGVAATLQFAIEGLEIPHVIVCGHSHCGAIAGLYQPLESPKFELLKRWIQFGDRAKKMALQTTKADMPKQELLSLTEKLSVLYQLEHLMSYPFVASRVKEGKLKLHGWYFKIETGQLWYYDTQQYRFLPLVSGSQKGGK